jgi:hypothetical protein
MSTIKSYCCDECWKRSDRIGINIFEVGRDALENMVINYASGIFDVHLCLACFNKMKKKFGLCIDNDCVIRSENEHKMLSQNG